MSKFTRKRWSYKDTELRLDDINANLSIDEAKEKFAYIKESRVTAAWYRGRMGRLIRQVDPIAFSVVHNEWELEFTRIGSVRTKPTLKNGNLKNRV